MNSDNEGIHTSDNGTYIQGSITFSMQSCRRKGDSDKVNDDQEIFMWSDVLEVILRGEQQNFAKLMDVYLQHE